MFVKSMERKKISDGFRIKYMEIYLFKQCNKKNFYGIPFLE